MRPRIRREVCELAVLHIQFHVDEVLLRCYVLGAVCPIPSVLELSFERLHFESLHALLAGTYVNAVAATETVEHVDSLDEAHAFECSAESGQCAGFAHGRCCNFGFVENERTDSCVRADICTLVTLDTVLRIPFGNESCHTAFLISCSALGPCAVSIVLESADLEQVAVLSVDGTHDLVDECGIVVLCLGIVGELSPCGIDSELVVFAAAVNSLVVLVYHILTLLAVALDDEFLHLLYSEVNGDNLCDAEECALEDGVGAVAKTDFLSDLGSVDIINGDVILCEVTFHLVGKILGKLLTLPDGVEKECAAVAKTTGHVIHVQVSLYVASHEVGGVHQIGRADGLVAETEVRAGEAARFLRVVCEVCLAILVGVVADDLHRVLVGTYSTVSAETEEFSFVGAGVAEGDFGHQGQRCECHVVYDAESEVVLGLGKSEVFVYGEDLSGCGVFRSQTVAATDDDGGVFLAVEAFLDVEVEGFAVGTGFFGAVEHGNAFCCCGNGCEEVLGREGTVEVYCYETYLLALGDEVSIASWRACVTEPMAMITRSASGAP